MLLLCSNSVSPMHWYSYMLLKSQPLWFRQCYLFIHMEISAVTKHFIKATSGDHSKAYRATCFYWLLQLSDKFLKSEHTLLNNFLVESNFSNTFMGNFSIFSLSVPIYCSNSQSTPLTRQDKWGSVTKSLVEAVACFLTCGTLTCVPQDPNWSSDSHDSITLI